METKVVANKKIVEYLKSIGLYKKYVNYTLKDYDSKQEKLRSILGGKLRSTIIDSFEWDHTNEGMNFWSKQYNTFLEWFDKNRKIIFKYNVKI